MKTFTDKEKTISNYKRLLNLIDRKISYELSYKKVNDEIDRIISEHTEPVKELEMLMCYFEALINSHESLSIYIMGVTIITSSILMLTNWIEFLAILVIYFYLLFCAVIAFICYFSTTMKLYKWRFILECLQFKYEELHTKDTSMFQISPGNNWKIIAVRVQKSNKDKLPI